MSTVTVLAVSPAAVITRFTVPDPGQAVRQFDVHLVQAKVRALRARKRDRASGVAHHRR